MLAICSQEMVPGRAGRAELTHGSSGGHEVSGCPLDLGPSRLGPPDPPVDVIVRTPMVCERRSNASGGADSCTGSCHETAAASPDPDRVEPARHRAR